MKRVLSNDTITVLIEMPGIVGRFAGRFSDDGNSFTGRREWTRDGEASAYDATMTRVARK